MLDTMTLTKATAALCAALLVFLLGNFFAEFIYHPKEHGDHHEQAYSVDTGEEDHGGEEDAGPTIEELLASADIGKGEGVFRKCAACHAVADGENGVGPHLYGVVGRDVASADGFSYSGALVQVAQVWTPENLNGFLEKPSTYARGTSMGFNGLAKPQDRANVIAYLDSLDD
ncbi:MAG: cytochrome c family protein [Pseudomonadota bacterium]